LAHWPPSWPASWRRPAAAGRSSDDEQKRKERRWDVMMSLVHGWIKLKSHAEPVSAVDDELHGGTKMAEMKTELKKELEKNLNLLHTLRDEVRVRLHLAGMDLKEQWNKLEPHLEDAEKKRGGDRRRAQCGR